MPRSRWLFPLAFTLLVACEDAPDATGPGDPTDPVGIDEDLSWVQANLVPFRTDEPGGDASDLEALRDIIGDARVVALGEATHGTREFFRMKHRVLEFLVREMDFNLFAIEATWAESNDLNRYVHTGQGSSAALLSNLHFWTWNTQEVLDMIEWMRDHNQTSGAGRTISFLGFDMQFSQRAMGEVEAFRVELGEAGNRLGSLMAEGFVCWQIWNQARAYSAMPASHREECRAGIDAVYDDLAAHQAEYEAVTSPEAYAHARRAARVIVQHEYLASRDWVGVEPNPRERFMAENAEWLLDQGGPDAKIVLWAHNAHIWDLKPWMGWYLRSTYGDEMVNVGFSFARGSFNAVTRRQNQFFGLSEHSVGPPSPASYEFQFERLGSPRFLLDLRPLRANVPEGARWLTEPRLHRRIGAVYDPDRPGQFYTSVSLPLAYDVLIHFGGSSPSVLLPFVAN